MTTARYRRREVDHLGFIRRVLGELAGYEAVVFELLQNADDSESATSVRYTVRDDALLVEDDGGFTDCGDLNLGADDCLFLAAEGHRCDFHSFELVAGEDKRLRADTTGAFGIGFAAVYQIADYPEIISGHVHWVVNEAADDPDRRIRETEVVPPVAGTRIVLPWARDAKTEMSRKLGGRTVPVDVEDQFLRVLESVIPTGMLFLRKIERVELAVDTDLVHEVTKRTGDGECVLLSDGREERWRILTGDFAMDADELRSRYGEQIDEHRTAKVTVAIPFDSDLEGRFCATLPTREGTGMPLHINADFFPTADRRRLLLEAPVACDWNTAAIRAAARLLRVHITTLPETLGPIRMWQAFSNAKEAADAEASAGPLALAKAAYWEELEDEIPLHPLVWTTTDTWRTLEQARLTLPGDDQALPLIETLDVPVVHTGLRPFQNILLSLGVQRLAVSDVAAALDRLEVKNRAALDDLPDPLRDLAGRQMLWSLLESLLTRLQGEEQRRTANAALADVALIPTTRGELVSIDDVWQADTQTITLFSTLLPELRFVDDAQLPTEAERLLRLVPTFTTAAALNVLEGADAQFGEAATPEDLVAWFAHREDSFNAADGERLAALPIFPTADGPRPLAGLALPGDFDDELGVARLVDGATSRAHGVFLERLGAVRLNFVAYARDHLPRALADETLSETKKRRLVGLLVRRRSELESDASIRAALSGTALVECTDAKWRRPADVYIESETVRSVLGGRRPFARLPTTNKRGVIDFLTWVGVAVEPRSRDVLERIDAITNGPVTPSRARAVERIVEWLADIFPELGEHERLAFDDLRLREWLPEREREDWQRPVVLDAVYQDFLYASQGRFLELPRPLQGRARDLLLWLGVTITPTTDQVVAHLRHCSSTGEEIHRQVYTHLNNHADDPEVATLAQTPCLYFEDGWASPQDVYWTEHPFGRWRRRLGPEFGEFQQLLAALGVRDHPDHSDALKVLDEVSAEHAPENAILDDEDLRVVLEAWRLIEDALHRGELDDADVARLANKKVIPDSRGVLVQPNLLYFEDVPDLALLLPGIAAHIIRRPDGAWRAMRAAGVGDLSRAAQPRIVQFANRREATRLQERLHDRQAMLARVTSATGEADWEDISERLRAIEWLAGNDLTIVWELDAFSHRFASEPHSIDALWSATDRTLYVSDDTDEPPWEALGREIARALLPDTEPGPLALPVAAVLKAPTGEDANRILDSAGYPQLAPEIAVELDPAAVAGFAAADNPPEYEPPDWNIDDLDEFGSAETETSGAEEADTDEDVKAPPAGAAAGTGGRGGSESNGSADGTGDRGDGEAGGGLDAPGDLHQGRRRRDGSRRSRLRSYVVSGSTTNSRSTIDGERPEDAEDDDVDRAGVDAVLAYEETTGRTPIEKPHSFPGYDVESEAADGEIARYIEVKATDGPWDPFGVPLSSKQFTTAQSLEEQYWLYIVEYARDDDKRRIWMIQDPARRVTEFMFDDGWREAAASDVAEASADSTREEPPMAGEDGI